MGYNTLSTTNQLWRGNPPELYYARDLLDQQISEIFQ